MSSTALLPTWAAYLLSIGTPTLAFAGSLIGNLINRKSAHELQRRSNREEVMRTLRWAAELAVSEQPRTASLGVSQIVALGDSDMLDTAQQLFVDAALAATVEPAAEIVEEIERLGVRAVVRIVGTRDSEAAPGGPSPVQSGQGDSEGDTGDD